MSAVLNVAGVDPAAGAVVRHFARSSVALQSDRENASDLALHLDRSQALTYRLARAVETVADSAVGSHDDELVAVARALDLARILADIRDLIPPRPSSEAHHLQFALGRGFADARALALDLDLARAQRSRRQRVEGFRLALPRIAELAVQVQATCRLAQDLVKSLAQSRAADLIALGSAAAVGEPVKSEAPRRAVTQWAQPQPSALKLVSIATHVLPTRHRARYDEEWRSELFDLAALNAPRWTQIGYAIRLLDRAWELRHELLRRVRRAADQ
jgi:hypothetical protein